MPFSGYFEDFSNVLILKENPLNDLPFKTTPTERPLNAERSVRSVLNGYPLKSLKENNKSLNACRSKRSNRNSPFNSPRFLERGVRVESVQKGECRHA